MLTNKIVTSGWAVITINLADAKARLSELVERAATGERLVITKRGKPVLELVRPRTALQPIDRNELRALVERMPDNRRKRALTMRAIRDDARY